MKDVTLDSFDNFYCACQEHEKQSKEILPELIFCNLKRRCLSSKRNERRKNLTFSPIIYLQMKLFPICSYLKERHCFSF